MNQLKLEEREEQFCLFYRETGNGKEAALAAGYPARTAGKKALALLADKRIQRRLGQLRRAGKSYREDEIAAGLRRLAFGPVNDAVRLAVLGRELSSDELERLEGVRADGARTVILEKGRFVLPGTEALNEPLTRRKTR